MALDWSALHYGHHPGKRGRLGLSRDRDRGYGLLTALALADRDGAPLGPLCLELEAADGVHSTRAEQPLPRRSRLDRLAPVMAHVQGLEPGRTPVWIIDREADSVGHYRAWADAGRLMLVRADAARRVLREGRETTLGRAGRALQPRATREVLYKGRAARQFVGETAVVLHRPARRHRVGRDGRKRHRNVRGEPLPMRLIVSQVRDETGRVLATWLLLTNLPPEVSAATAALWYYWRWRIEGYHKLLKGAGQQVEHWQQETLARRLTVASMAVVVAWRLARARGPEARELREVLVRLSGRQMRRGPRAPGFTVPALLAGLGVLAPMLELLRDHDLADLRRLAAAHLPRLCRERG